VRSGGASRIRGANGSIGAAVSRRLRWGVALPDLLDLSLHTMVPALLANAAPSGAKLSRSRRHCGQRSRSVVDGNPWSMGAPRRLLLSQR
jgi:hypothetical protein